MDAINVLLNPPTFKYLSLISYLVYFMLLFHLPYLGMVLGSSLLSLVYARQKPEVSKDFIGLAMGRPAIWIGFGLLPVAGLAFLLKMQFFNTPIAIHLYLFRLLVILTFGFILLNLYLICRRWCENNEQNIGIKTILVGASGVLILFFYSFHFINLLSLTIFPEKWEFLKLPIPFPLFDIIPIIHYGGFFCLSLIITGTALLFFYFRWPEKRLPEAVPHYFFLKYHGFGLLLAGTLLMPLTVFWELYTLPAYSLSIGVFIISGLIITILFILLALVVSMIKNYNRPMPFRIVFSFIMALLLFGLVIGKNQTLRFNSSRETIAVLKSEALKNRKDIIDQREELYSKAMVIDEKAGEKIYNNICTACHSFDKKILGPPLNEVLPKYSSNQDELMAFLKNPKKIDPKYPAMPSPGLSTIQIKSVVKFLMIEIGAEAKKQEQNNQPDHPLEKGE